MLVYLSDSATSGTREVLCERFCMLICPCYSVGKQIVNVPSFVVRLDSQKHIDFALTSPYGGGRPGRVKRRRAKQAAKQEGGEEEEEE